MDKIEAALATLPHEPGVYLYRNKEATVIYVGKAVDLARRVRQYFRGTYAAGDKTKQLVAEIAEVSTISVASEFDALLLEAKLIRQYMPKYNVISRDDKSPLYVAFTLSEQLPQILSLRRNQVPAVTAVRKNAVYGPFQSAHALRILMRQIRRVIPYCTQKSRTGKPCFYTHIGLCSPCPSEITGVKDETQKQALIRTYRGNIRRLKNLFDGNSAGIRAQYEREMHTHAGKLEFETAAAYKKRIDALYNLSLFRYDPAVFLEEGVTSVYENELAELLAFLAPYYPHLTKLSRIECFDMSQLYGTAAVGSMVVLVDGRPDTSSYRRFRIRRKGTVSDTSMMREVLTRRLKRRGLHSCRRR